MHDDFEPIGAIVERLVKKVAPAEGGETASATSRHSGGGTAVILQFERKGTGAAGPTSPPRQDFRDRTADGRVGPSRHPPATGGLGNARRAKL